MNYRCKHTVEAMLWTDTDRNRESFATWFEVHDVMFETVGSLIRLPIGDGNADIEPGTWVLWMDGEFMTMDEESFAEAYEAVQ